MWVLEATINFGAQLGEPTVTWYFDTEEEVDDMLNYLTDTLNPLNITWCYMREHLADLDYRGVVSQQGDDYLYLEGHEEHCHPMGNCCDGCLKLNGFDIDESTPAVTVADVIAANKMMVEG